MPAEQAMWVTLVMDQRLKRVVVASVCSYKILGVDKAIERFGKDAPRFTFDWATEPAQNLPRAKEWLRRQGVPERECYPLLKKIVRQVMDTAGVT